jgi:hypothetical protein
MRVKLKLFELGIITSFYDPIKLDQHQCSAQSVSDKNFALSFISKEERESPTSTLDRLTMSIALSTNAARMMFFSSCHTQKRLNRHQKGRQKNHATD